MTDKPSYQLHHICVYDSEPRESMWTFLRWYHALPAYYWGGEDFHLTDEGHVDYTFLACGSPFQLQLEAPPFQFTYEQEWWAEHGRGLNHICWIVPDARASYEHLRGVGCELAQEYTEFGVYNGFVAKDPEGRWIEIMEYRGDFKTPDVEFRPVGVPKLQGLGTLQLVSDLDGATRWYQDVMGLRVLRDLRRGDGGRVELVDGLYHEDEHPTTLTLGTPEGEAEQQMFDRHGPCIAAATYRAHDVSAAYGDALSAGFESVSEPADNGRGRPAAVLREPNGNLIELREIEDPERPS